MPFEFYAAIAAQIGTVLAVAVILERRITALETNMQWLLAGRRTKPEEPHEPHHRP